MHSGAGSINCAKFCLDLDPEPEPKLFQNRNRTRNKSLRFHNTVNYKASQNLKTIGSKSTDLILKSFKQYIHLVTKSF